MVALSGTCNSRTVPDRLRPRTSFIESSTGLAGLGNEQAQGKNATGKGLSKPSPAHERQMQGEARSSLKTVLVQAHGSVTDIFFMATWCIILGFFSVALLWIVCDGGNEGANEMVAREGCRPEAVKAFRESEDAEEDEQLEEAKKQCFKLNSDELVDSMGLSGMALLEMDGVAGVSGLPLMQVLPLTAIQAWFLQFCILWFMAHRVIRLSYVPPVEKELPYAIIFAAIYLHFINCVSGLPFACTIVRHIHELHHKRLHLMVALTCFLVDGLIVPITSLVVGALYLCTSATVSDVILNSCAVAFIGNIDNWILTLIGKINQGTGETMDDEFKRTKTKQADSMTVYIPVNQPLMKAMAWGFCMVPVVPSCFAALIAHIGTHVLHI